MLTLSVPSRLGRQAHQDRIDIAASLKPKQSAAIMDKIKLGIAPAPDKLSVALLRRERHRHPLTNERWVNFKKRLTHRAGQSEILGEMGITITVEMIIENPTNAAMYLTVRNPEIISG